MTAEEFCQALAFTESHNNPNVELGDDGRALGRWQVHPDWVWSVAQHFHLQPLLDETWDRFIRRLVMAFYREYIAYMPAVEVAMRFHLGHFSKPGETDWDAGYAERFEKFAGS